MKYRTTHPWITFQLTVPQHSGLWLRLGELASKCEHLCGAPLAPWIESELNQIYLAKGVMATTAIEGNTLTEDQVLQQVKGELNLPPSQQYLQREVQNIIEACNEEVREHLESHEETPLLDEARIRRYNRQVLNGLDLNEDVVPGEYRYHNVVVGNVYRGAPAEDCPYLMDRLCQWLNSSDFATPENEPDFRLPITIIKAIVAHIYLAWIHPFGDGNGRTARLLEFHILYSAGIPLPAAHLLSDHYNLTRTRYYQQLDRASKSDGDIIPFLMYAIEGFLDGIRSQISRIRQFHLRIAWEHFATERLGEEKPSPARERRRNLIFSLGRTHHNQWVPTAAIEELNRELALAYVHAGDRMLSRDLNALKKLGLLERQHGKVRAMVEQIEAFLPRQVKQPN